MTGYDPMGELAADLDDATRPIRSVTVAPPPRPAPIEHVAAQLVPEPGVPPAVEVDRRPAQRSRRSAPERTLAPVALRTTTAALPTAIVERIQRLRLDYGVDGRSFNITNFFNGAIDRLPSSSADLEGALERYRDQLNIGKRLGEDGWHLETRFAVRIGQAQERTVAIAIRSLYERTGHRHFKQDLWAIALLRELGEST